jgi:hypothetical protein
MFKEPLLAPKQVPFLIVSITFINGLTSIVTVKLGPGQLPDIGETVYVTVAGFEVLLISV